MEKFKERIVERPTKESSVINVIRLVRVKFHQCTVRVFVVADAVSVYEISRGCRSNRIADVVEQDKVQRTSQNFTIEQVGCRSSELRKFQLAQVNVRLSNIALVVR